MGLFGRKRKGDLAIEGIPGTARVVASEQITHWGDHGDEVNPLAELGFGSVPYTLELEVTLDDGRTPYTVRGKFRVPVAHDLADVGMLVALRADPDDPTKLELDWETSDTAKGINPEQDRARFAATRGGIYANFPAASRKQMIDGWVAAANGGQLSRAEFDSALDDAITSGILNDADAAAARASLKA